MRVYFILTVVLIISSCRLSNSTDEISSDIISNPMAPDGNDDGEVAAFTFKEMEIDLGRMSQGEKKELVFEFENTGKQPLLISAVNASCGCTLPQGWPEGPIPRGEEGQIKAIFDSSNKTGETSSEITVVANTLPSSTILVIRANVVAPEQTAE